MKTFDSEKALRKLNRKRNTSTYIKYSVFIVSILMFVAGVIFLTRAVFTSSEEFTVIDAKVGEFSTGDLIFAYNVEGTNQKTLPEDMSNYFYLSNSCTNGTTFTVTGTDWQNGTINNISKNGTKCTMYFAKPTIRYYLDGVEVSKETAISNHFDISTAPTCDKGATITYDESTNENTTNNVTEIGTICNIYFKANPSYSVTISVTNGTTSENTIYVGYGGNGTVTITPTTSDYYLASASCTNGYTTSAVTGEDSTSPQTITIFNENNNNNSECTFVEAPLVNQDGYNYWRSTTHYSSKSAPSTVYANYARVGSKSLVRTSYSNGSPTGHSACINPSGTLLFCINSGFYYSNGGSGTSVESALKNAMESALGTTAWSCYHGSSGGAGCDFYDGSSVYAYSDGDIMSCVSSSCCYISSGEAYCN